MSATETAALSLPAFVHIYTPLAIVAAAYFANRFSAESLLQSRYEEFANLYCRFWKNKAFQEVRTLLVVKPEYEKAAKIIHKRLTNRSEITKTEYRTLDKIDRYVSFVNRMNAMRARYRRWPHNSDRTLWKNNLIEESLFEHFLAQIKRNRRMELYAYVATFFYIKPMARGEGKRNGELKRSLNYVRRQLEILDTEPGAEEKRKMFWDYTFKTLRYRTDLSEADARRYLRDLLHYEEDKSWHDLARDHRF